MKKEIISFEALKEQASVLQSNLQSSQKILTGFNWKQLLPMRALRPQLPFGKIDEMLKNQQVMATRSRKASKRLLKEYSDLRVREFLKIIEPWFEKVVECYASLLEVSRQRKLRDIGDKEFTISNFNQSMKKYNDNLAELITLGPALNHAWIQTTK